MLLAVGLAASSGATSAAAEPAKPLPAAPAAAATSGPTLLGTLRNALKADEAKNARRSAYGQAAAARPAAAARLEPAKKRASFLGALAKAIGGGEARNVGRIEVGRVEDAEIRQQESQLLPQFRQLMCVELACLRRICQVDAKSLVEIVKATKSGFAALVHKYALSQARQRRGVLVSASDAADPRADFQGLLLPLVEAKLGAEQAQRYREECEQRAQQRRRAVVLNLVAALDEHLVLSAEQREKMIQALSADYQPGWEQFLQMFSYNTEYLPGVRSDLVIPHLDERQKNIWHQVPKIGVGSYVGLHIITMAGGVESPEIQELDRVIREAHDEK